MVAKANPPRPPGPSWRQIVKQVAAKHGVTFEAIIGHQRNKALVIARHEALYRLSQETTFSLVKIGHKMQRDHTSVMYGIHKHKERMEAGET
jgi:chromosomal replication initiation ATPase DnaA